MNITRDNYEHYLVDFFDGSLSDEEAQEVRVFLLANPDLDPGTDWPVLSVNEQRGSTGVFERLKHDPQYESKAMWLAAIAEGAENGIMVAEALNDATDAAEIATYKRLRLQADGAVVYSGKAGLKRGGVVLPIRAWAIRVAAAAAVLLIAGSMYLVVNAPHEAQLAETTAAPLNIRRTPKEGYTVAEQSVAPSLDARNVPADERMVTTTGGVRPTPQDNARPEQQAPVAFIEPLRAPMVEHFTRPAIGEQLALTWPIDRFDDEGPRGEGDRPVQPVTTPSQTYTAAEFLAIRAQERLTGRKPEDGKSLSQALSTRAFEKMADLTDGQVAIAPGTAGKRGSFSFKLGPVAVER